MTSDSSPLSFITPLDSPVSVLTADGPSLSVSGRGPLSNSSFHVPSVPSVAHVPRPEIERDVLSAVRILTGESRGVMKDRVEGSEVM